MIMGSGAWRLISNLHGKNAGKMQGMLGAPAPAELPARARGLTTSDKVCGQAKWNPRLIRCQGAGHQAVGIVPPSTTYSVPVMAAARLDARKAIRSATSAGLAGRPKGMPPREFMMICLPPS